MITKNDVFGKISKIGYLSRAEIYGEFPGESSEVIDAMLANLESSNMLREVRYESPDGPGILYYRVA